MLSGAIGCIGFSWVRQHSSLLNFPFAFALAWLGGPVCDQVID
jgi:hypothetical protein